MNEATVSTQVVPCNTECGMDCACRMTGMNSMYVFGVIIVIGLAIQVFLQTKMLKAIRKLKK